MAHGTEQQMPTEIPRELDRWNWGAFFLNWIWGIGNSTYIALLALIPGINIVMMVVLGLKGSRWAWRNRYWKDAEHFRITQRRWAQWGAVIWAVVIAVLVGTLASLPFAMKSSEAYKMSMEMIRNDQRVIDTLGQPIEAGYWVGGNVTVEAGGTGNARLAIPVTGSIASGMVRSLAVRRDGGWDIRLLFVTSHDSAARIVLVNKDRLRISDTELGI